MQTVPVSGANAVALTNLAAARALSIMVMHQHPSVPTTLQVCTAPAPEAAELQDAFLVVSLERVDRAAASQDSVSLVGRLVSRARRPRVPPKACVNYAFLLREWSDAATSGLPAADKLRDVLCADNVPKVTADAEQLQQVVRARLECGVENVTGVLQLAALVRPTGGHWPADGAAAQLPDVWHLMAALTPQSRSTAWDKLHENAAALAEPRGEPGTGLQDCAHIQCANLPAAAVFLRQLCADSAARALLDAPASSHAGADAPQQRHVAAATGTEASQQLQLVVTFDSNCRAVYSPAGVAANAAEGLPDAAKQAPDHRELLGLLQVLPVPVRECICELLDVPLAEHTERAQAEAVAVPLPLLHDNERDSAFDAPAEMLRAPAPAGASPGDLSVDGSARSCSQSNVERMTGAAAGEDMAGAQGAAGGSEPGRVSAAVALARGMRQHGAVPEGAGLLEVLVDDGRPALLRWSNGAETELPLPLTSHAVVLALRRLHRIESQRPGASAALPLLRPDLAAATDCGGFWNPFHTDNRAGISGTLHRISAIMDFDRTVVGLTLRVGRHVHGAARPFVDLLAAARLHDKYRRRERPGGEAALVSPSLLVLGGPAVGKTTVLRDIAHQLSVHFGLGRRVIVVDTSSEIGGHGQVPHAAIGKARRMLVPRASNQASVLKEALQNHNPDVIVVDEIGTRREVAAVQSICQRGVMMVATAHATSLAALVRNPDLNALLGSTHEVILSAEELRRADGLAGRARGSKTRQERRGPPVFQTVVEILGPTQWRIHEDAAASVDAILAGNEPPTQLRTLQDGHLYVQFSGPRMP